MPALQKNAHPLKVLVLHGPNLNLLGKREPAIYGTLTLDEIDQRLHGLADELGVSLKIVQSNHEGVLIDTLQDAVGAFDGVLVNAGGYTHTSVALRDALKAVGLPAVEVHMSNTFAREDFRHFSYLTPVCMGLVVGFGAASYLLGLRGLVYHLTGSGSQGRV